MKKIFLLASFTFIGLLGFAQGIEFIEGDLEAAKKKAIDEEKIIFVDAYTTWCGPCKRLSKEVFPQKAAGDFYNANFINLKLDMEKGDGPAFGMEYGIRSYPTLLFITGDGELVMKSVGGRKVEQLIETGRTALKAFDFSAEYKEEYDKGNREFDLVYNYVKSLNKSGKSSLKISNDYFRNQEGLTPDQNLKLLSIAATEADSKLFDRFIENKVALKELTSAEAVKRQIVTACGNTAAKALEYESVDLLQEAVDKARLHAPEESKEVRADWVGNYFEYMEDPIEFTQFMDGLSKETDSITRYRIGEATLNKYSKEADVLKMAAEQIKLGIKTEKNNYKYRLLLARIYKEQGDQKNAKKMAMKALDLAKESDQGVDEINKLIDSI